MATRCRAVTAYDDSILQQYADALYREASVIVLQTAIWFGCVGFIISAMMIALMNAFGHQIGLRGDMSAPAIMFAVVVTAVGVIWGISEGRRRAFRLKLQAQQILCQRQIELNTRAASR